MKATDRLTMCQGKECNAGWLKTPKTCDREHCPQRVLSDARAVLNDMDIRGVTDEEVRYMIRMFSRFEREACAIEAERVLVNSQQHHSYWRDGWNEACHDVADRIRIRGR